MSRSILRLSLYLFCVASEDCLHLHSAWGTRERVGRAVRLTMPHTSSDMGAAEGSGKL